MNGAEVVAESSGGFPASKRGASGVWSMNYLKKLEDEVSAWHQVSIHPHRFGGREFRFQSAEVGHVHTGGIVDIPFPRPIRDALLADGLAEEHHWVPDSGWITFQMRCEADLSHALWLMRLSYLRYLLKAAAHPSKVFEQESGQLHLSTRLQSLLEPFVPKTARQVSAEPVRA
jgi:Family of unknown function (DUF5519)